MVRVRLLADAMLGKLTKWLRLAGVEVEYSREADDETLLKRALRENLVLLTRDEQLAARARGYVRTVRVKSNNPEKQLLEVAKALKINLKPTAKICSHCGSALKRVAKKSVEGKMFPRVYRSHRVFWQCAGCGQVYWKGSHWKGITKALKKAKRK